MKIIGKDDPLAGSGVNQAFARQGRADAGTFLQALKAASGQARESGNPYQTPPPDREKLQEWIRMLRLQMNQSLIRSALLSGSEDDSGMYPTGRSMLDLPPGLFNKPDILSKNGPACEKNQAPSRSMKACMRTPGHYEKIIGRAAGECGVDPNLVRAVIQVESGFRPDAVSPRGAKGLMQLMPATARELGVRDPFDPEENIRAGTRYLKGLLDRYDGDRELALAAYNWGMGNVERNPDRLPRETLHYIARVNRQYQG